MADETTTTAAPSPEAGSPADESSFPLFPQTGGLITNAGFDDLPTPRGDAAPTTGETDTPSPDTTPKADGPAWQKALEDALAAEDFDPQLLLSHEKTRSVLQSVKDRELAKERQRLESEVQRQRDEWLARQRAEFEVQQERERQQWLQSLDGEEFKREILGQETVKRFRADAENTALQRYYADTWTPLEPELTPEVRDQIAQNATQYRSMADMLKAIVAAERDHAARSALATLRESKDFQKLVDEAAEQKFRQRAAETRLNTPTPDTGEGDYISPGRFDPRRLTDWRTPEERKKALADFEKIAFGRQSA